MQASVSTLVFRLINFYVRRVCAKEITSQGNVLSKAVKMVRQEAPRTKRSESLAPEILPLSGLWLTTKSRNDPVQRKPES